MAIMLTACPLETAPIEMKGRKGPIMVDTDEHPRPQTQPADLAKLKPVFVPERKFQIFLL